MNPDNIEPRQGDSPRDILRKRDNAIRLQQQSLTPPKVPRAKPPTTTAEVPPGTAPIRAVSAPGALPDNLHEVANPVDQPAVEEKLDRLAALSDPTATKQAIADSLLPADQDA